MDPEDEAADPGHLLRLELGGRLPAQPVCPSGQEQRQQVNYQPEEQQVWYGMVWYGMVW